MKWKSIILPLGVILFGALVFHAQIRRWINSPSQQDVIQKVFSNQDIYKTFSTSTNVTVRLLHARMDLQGINFVQLKGYTNDPAVPLSPAQAQKIQNLLQAPSSYLFLRDVRKQCIPIYGVLFVFNSEHQTVRVALCFQCNMLGVFTGNDDNQDSVNSETDFDPVRGKLVTMLKEIFPNDSTIQNLKGKQH